MKEIKCPKDIGFENTFPDKECEMRKFYGDCFHCWSSSIADIKHREVYSALQKLTKDGMYLDSNGNACSADELFIKIYNEEVLNILKSK